MAVMNITPDSFSDGGTFYHGHANLDLVLMYAERCLSEGASILDVGGESTRPGAKPVSNDEELARVIPVIEGLASRFDAVISVDTSTPQVMIAAARAGAHHAPHCQRSGCRRLQLMEGDVRRAQQAAHRCQEGARAAALRRSASVFRRVGPLRR